MIHKIAERLSVPAEKIFGASPYATGRKHHVTIARVAVMVLLYGEKFKITQIAREFGQSHCTVIYNLRTRHENLMKFDRDYQAKYKAFLKEVRLMELQDPVLENEAGLILSPQEFLASSTNANLYELEKLIQSPQIQSRIRAYKTTHKLIF